MLDEVAGADAEVDEAAAEAVSLAAPEEEEDELDPVLQAARARVAAAVTATRLVTRCKGVSFGSSDGSGGPEATSHPVGMGGRRDSLAEPLPAEPPARRPPGGDYC